MNTTTTEAAAPAVAERTPQLMLVEGNEAAALGVALARPDMVAVYPITPQTSLVEKLAKLIADGGMDADIVDAEGEHSVLSVLQGSALDPSGSVVVFHTLRELIPALSAASNDSPPREYPSLSDRLA